MAIGPMQVTVADAAAVSVAVVMVMPMAVVVMVVMAMMVVMMAFVRGGNVRRSQRKRCRGGRGECSATYQS